MKISTVLLVLCCFSGTLCCKNNDPNADKCPKGMQWRCAAEHTLKSCNQLTSGIMGIMFIPVKPPQECVYGCYCPEEKWRKDETCVHSERDCCDGDLAYSPCGSACPKKCVDAHLKPELRPVCFKVCVRGCFCPGNKWRHGNRCLGSAQACMTAIANYEEGSG